MVRELELDRWLQQKIGPGFQRVSLAGDASFRRYYRVIQGLESYVLMDAPPPEDSARFVAQALLLARAGLRVPEIIAENTTDGFLLLSDFGDELYLKALNDDSADVLYTAAFEALICLQRTKAPLPIFSRVFMQRQLIDLFEGWYLKYQPVSARLAKLQPYLRSLYAILFENARRQPQVLIHRDYHSRNLMVLDQHRFSDDNYAGEKSRFTTQKTSFSASAKLQMPGVLDFQDAMIGPMTYDLVSLLQDCYIEWPRVRVEQWVRTFQERAFEEGLLKQRVSAEEFLRWFDLCGLQRHLKNLGIFTRLYHRDHKADYLKEIPRVLNYIYQTLDSYQDLLPFMTIFEDPITV